MASLRDRRYTNPFVTQDKSDEDIDEEGYQFDDDDDLRFRKEYQFINKNKDIIPIYRQYTDQKKTYTKHLNNFRQQKVKEQN